MILMHDKSQIQCIWPDCKPQNGGLTFLTLWQLPTVNSKPVFLYIMNTEIWILHLTRASFGWLFFCPWILYVRVVETCL